MNQYTLEDFRSAHSCPTCDRSFDTRSGLGRHHSLTHGEKLPKRTVPCTQCGKEVEREKWQIEEQNRWFCSGDCRGEWHSENRSGSNNSQWKPKDSRECNYCGDPFEVAPSSDRKYCSRECYDDWQSENRGGENNPLWKEPVSLECEQCGGSFEVTPARKDTARFCSWECTNDYKSSINGPEHPLWTNGTDVYRSVRNALGPKGWSSTSREVRERHGNECEMCGKSGAENGRALSVHHIIPIMTGGDNGDYNLIPLCQPCHDKAERYTQKIPGVERPLVE